MRKPAGQKYAWAGALLLAVAVASRAQQSASSPTAAPAPQGKAAPAAQSPAAIESHGGPDSVLERVLSHWPAGRIDTAAHPGEWSYEQGVLLDGMLAEWRTTGDGRLFDYVKAAVDRSVDSNGVIHFDGGAPYPADAHALNNIEMGRSVLVLYRVLQQDRYYKASKSLHDAMLQQPKNSAGAYAQNAKYPEQVSLGGAYLAEPFMATYARTFDQPSDMDSIGSQLLLIDAKMRDRQTGLLRHGWDPSRQAAWADKRTGLSPEVWSRAMGWYSMALIEVLERMPAIDPQRAALEALARRTLENIVRYQDPASGLWWQVMDKGFTKGNYLESSASCMLIYTLAKAIRLDLLPLSYEVNVTRGWAGVQSHFVQPDGTFSGTVKTAGLVSEPTRTATYDSYTADPVVDNDPRGVGAYLLAHSEITERERAADLVRRARGKTVLVDAWFSSDKRKSADGHEEPYRYKWNDDSDLGYSAWGRMFQQYGMRTEALDHAPRAEDLKGVDVYVIASPDIPAVNPQPNYMDKASADAIEAWVRAGGVLLLMENDSEHADQTHLDMLSDSFGIHFNPVTRNRENADDLAATLVKIPSGAGGIFRHDYTVLEHGICTITVSTGAKSILTEGGDVLMAIAHPGRGVVYANVDPWLYNEYTDGRNVPLGEQNFAAGQDLTHWVVYQAITH